MVYDNMGMGMVGVCIYLGYGSAFNSGRVSFTHRVLVAYGFWWWVGIGLCVCFFIQ